MSQSQSSTTDTQVLLQSMLQRLKLQPGREGEAYLHPPVPQTAASESGHDGERRGYDFQAFGGENSIHVNGFVPAEQERGELGSNGIPLKVHQMRKWDSRGEFGIPEWDSGFGPAAFSFKGRERQRQSGHDYKMKKSPISFFSPKDNIKRGMNKSRVSGQDTPTGAGLIPVKAFKDDDVTSFQRTKDEIQGERGSHSSSTIIPSGKDTVTPAVGQSEDHDQGFKPRVYAWSLKTKEATILDTDNGNGGLEAWANSKDTQIGLDVISQEKTENNPLRRKDKFRLSDNKARRWTQKLKERWRERPGSFIKKAKKEGGRVDMKSEHETESSPENQLSTTENVNTSNEEGEGILLTLDRSDHRISLPTVPEDCTTNEGPTRSNTDFEFGLGSFSLLEEILTGQEWDKFLSQNPQTFSANHGSSEQLANQTQNPPNQDGGQSSLVSIQQRGGNYQWSFMGSESSQNVDVGVAPTSTAVFIPVSMEISEGNHATANDVHSEADQSEPMEHGHNQSDMKPEKSRAKRQVRALEDFSCAKSAESLDNSALKSRVHLNRKRVHESVETGESLQMEKTDDRKEADRDGSIVSPSVISNHGTGEVQNNNLMFLYLHKSSFRSLSPSSSAPAPRGVLKHSISQDSEFSISMETMTKRRRLDEKRRVHFSEEVIAIEPPELDLDADSEEDSGTEEDSVIEEQEARVDQEPMEELMAPARRPALPAWIRALKRRNTGKKHRQ
ncbi:hypothetical protein LDENG_00027140 [Lucifuga dentata]|nr:hypothetical protein LDENG_00027140 [Lucifuga dentata]